MKDRPDRTRRTPRRDHRAELEALLRAASAHLPLVRDVEMVGNEPRAVCDEPDAPSLADVIRPYGNLTPGQFVTLGVSMARALASLGSCGFSPVSLTCRDVRIESDGRPVLDIAGLHRSASWADSCDLFRHFCVELSGFTSWPLAAAPERLERLASSVSVHEPPDEWLRRAESEFFRVAPPEAITNPVTSRAPSADEAGSVDVLMPAHEQSAPPSTNTARSTPAPHFSRLAPWRWAAQDAVAQWRQRSPLTAAMTSARSNERFQKILGAVRRRRRLIVTAACVCTAAVVAGTVHLQPDSSREPAGSFSLATSSPRRGPPRPSVRPSASPSSSLSPPRHTQGTHRAEVTASPSRRAAAVQAVGVDASETPEHAAVALIEQRLLCREEQDLGCLARVVEDGSPLWAYDYAELGSASTRGSAASGARASPDPRPTSRNISNRLAQVLDISGAATLVRLNATTDESAGALSSVHSTVPRSDQTDGSAATATPTPPSGRGVVTVSIIVLATRASDRWLLRLITLA